MDIDCAVPTAVQLAQWKMTGLGYGQSSISHMVQHAMEIVNYLTPTPKPSVSIMSMKETYAVVLELT